MTNDAILPIAERPVPAKSPSGRPVDGIASLLAGLATGLSIITALWFFFGFAENDTRPEHLTSAFVLTVGLFSFAIAPFAIVARIAWQAYRSGATRRGLLWTLFLMLPWIGLGIIATLHTPLPMWCGVLMASFTGLLSLWAFVSVILDWKQVSGPKVTPVSQGNEMT